MSMMRFGIGMIVFHKGFGILFVEYSNSVALANRDYSISLFHGTSPYFRET